eukprot:GFKZ01008495.1.p2 GENE.GFKZ01008495.1~~GFKZ01008495.1.p2  ORF type:complete len:549 (-),score=131.44 GFKZ01008495.1:3137-4621(-)
MVDPMAVLGAAAAAKLAGDRLVRDFVAYIRETTTSMQSTAQSYTTSSRKRPNRRPRRGARLSRPMKPSTSGFGRRPNSHRNSKKVSTMTDAELEAELDARRRRRARERDAYTRAMRSDKLAALENELDSLRRELGRIDGPPVAIPMSSRPAGTPPTTKWEALPRSRRPPLPTPSQAVNSQPSSPNVPGIPTPTTARPGGPPPPPPPPPPPGMGGGGDDDEEAIDPEKQAREKLERQKRREAKKKEREQKRKKMTLADIIRSAGPDPIKKLKPMTKKPADQEQEDWERAKREREEREEKEEAERIEKERMAKEGPKRTSENSPKKGDGEKKKDADDNNVDKKEGTGSEKKEADSKSSTKEEGETVGKSSGDKGGEKSDNKKNDEEKDGSGDGATTPDSKTASDPQKSEEKAKSTATKESNSDASAGNKGSTTSKDIDKKSVGGEESSQPPEKKGTEDAPAKKGIENVAPNIPPPSAQAEKQTTTDSSESVSKDQE